MLRNTFALKTGLIPYMALTHQVRPPLPFLSSPTDHCMLQESLDENLRGKGGEALEEYERELHLYEEELRKERELACADEFVKRKLDSVQELAEEVGYMRGAGESLSPALRPFPYGRDFRSPQLSDPRPRLPTLPSSRTPCHSPRHSCTSCSTRNDGPGGSLGGLARVLRQLGCGVQSRCATRCSTGSYGGRNRRRCD